jgi:hypothetical protein
MHCQTQNPATEIRGGILEKPDDNLLSRYTHYHGPRVLNGRVRDGNGCVHTGMVAGNIEEFQIADFRLQIYKSAI